MRAPLSVLSPAVDLDDVIAASATVEAPPREVFAFLAAMHNHWTLAGRRIELLELRQDAAGHGTGVVLMRGPLGIRRHARTRVLQVREPASLAGIAEIGPGTRAAVRWQLEPLARERTRVSLSASVLAAGPVDRLLLRAGGRRWLRHVFAATLRLLGERLASERSAGVPAQLVSSDRALVDLVRPVRQP
jgi:uncharacterized protein YndB with AHSA1/START domain